MVPDLTSVFQPEPDRDPHDWGTLSWLLSETDRAVMGISAAIMEVKPGARCGAHRHPNANEALFVENGVIDLRTTLIRVRLSAGETHVIPAGTAHEIINTGDTDAKLLVLHSHPDRIYQPTNWIEEKKARRTKKPA